VGGAVDAAYERAARHGDGWIMGGGAPDQFSERAAKAREAWQAAGRDGAPRLMALSYFSLGDRAEEAAKRYLLDYYAFAGQYAGMIADGAAKDAGTVKQYVEGFAAAGCDELVLFPCDPDPEQVDLLADAIA
jgi:alkanesulfonate monooxygenase SsuD/methylene tetrahydromethanopterin reductase-like flavin-dependent oxidoreductase (luciferase family)